MQKYLQHYNCKFETRCVGLRMDVCKRDTGRKTEVIKLEKSSRESKVRFWRQKEGENTEENIEQKWRRKYKGVKWENKNERTDAEHNARKDALWSIIGKKRWSEARKGKRSDKKKRLMVLKRLNKNPISKMLQLFLQNCRRDEVEFTLVSRFSLPAMGYWYRSCFNIVFF